VARACAVFLERWDGVDVADGARQLTELLPEHIPGPLKLVILRALRQIDVPAFPSIEAFRVAVARFATAEPELRTLADVRRARRETRVTLDEIARQTALPLYMLRQLEWGDFRQWRNAEWSARVARAYARAARLDPDRVLAIIEEERRAQLKAEDDRRARSESKDDNNRPARPAQVLAPPAVPDRVNADPLDALPLYARVPATTMLEPPALRRRARRSRRIRRFGLAAAAVGMFVAGLGVGGAIVERRPGGEQVAATRPPVSNAPLAHPEPLPPEASSPTDAQGAPTVSSTATTGETMAPSEIQPAARAPRDEIPSEAAPAQPVPHLMTASAAGAPAFSPSFSNIGSAVFYHRDEGVGTALVKADRDETTGDLRVINIVEDNARNYHVRPSPDGLRIAFDSDREGERGVYIANADGTEVRRVSGPGFAAVPSWSPDGQLLAFVHAEQDRRVWNLWLLNLHTNEMRRVTDYRYGQPWGASWFPDGRRVAYSHEDRLTVLDLPTGTKRIYKSPREGRLVRTPAVSPDGRHIVFQVYRDGAWMLDLRDGSMERILADPTAEEFAWDSSGRRLAFHSRRSGNWSVWIMAGPES
jgi:Tol biopolymer transport system component